MSDCVKTALVFPGLGSECKGMGMGMPERFQSVRALYDLAKRIWGQRYYGNLLREMASGGPDLHRIEYSLPALFLVSMATVCAVQEESRLSLEGIADCVAGHSIGEFAAVTAAGGVQLQDMLEMVHCKAKKLQSMVFEPPCSVYVVKANADIVHRFVHEFGGNACIWVANINAPDQTVVSGYQDAVSEFVAELKKKNIASVHMRRISIPVHTPLLEPVSQELKSALVKIKISEPRVPFVASITGNVVHEKDIGSVIAGVPTWQVNWPASMRHLVETLKVGHFVECGPGRILSGLVGRNCPRGMDVNLHALSSLEQIESYAGAIKVGRSGHSRIFDKRIGCVPAGVT